MAYLFNTTLKHLYLLGLASTWVIISGPFENSSQYFRPLIVIKAPFHPSPWESLHFKSNSHAVGEVRKQHVWWYSLLSWYCWLLSHAPKDQLISDATPFVVNVTSMQTSIIVEEFLMFHQSHKNICIIDSQERRF